MERNRPMKREISKFRKVMAFGMVAAMAIGVSACGGDKNNNSNNDGGNNGNVNTPITYIVTFRVDGIVYSAMPLCFNGNIIDNFHLEFKNGKVISFDAEKGYDTLKGIIETDGGTKRIGEVALIDKNSPIASMNTLFFNTLFDENASCHLALGKAYPTTLLDGDKLTKKQLSQLGANDSSEHVDFMIGTPDVNVYGITKQNNEIPIIVNGEFII